VHADDAASGEGKGDFWSAHPADGDDAHPESAPIRTPLDVATPYRLSGGVALGRGIRFNNPYRLQTELGNDAESLSLTATYADVHLGVSFGGTGRFSHGAALHASFALDGVPQEVLTPSYVLLYQAAPRLELVGRAGFPIVVEPDTNVGLEVAAGTVFDLTAALGITASLVGDLFYGAATLDSSKTAIPVVSLELGLRYDYEVLP
jgi:hypothetical protein